MDLSALNQRQKDAVTAPLGPVLVLAGPGSGKTKTLTYRIAYLVDSKQAHPKNILALTFTNKAAQEMRQRVSGLLARYKSAADQLTMGTFHSVCARLLRREIPALGYSGDFVIFDTDDQQRQLKEVLEELRVDPKRLPASMFAALVSRAKNLLQLPSELNLNLEPAFAEKLREVYSRYQDRLYRQNALDFDDLLMLMVKILQNFPKVLRKYQQQFGYILVDEYQDTNQAQYTLLKLLGEHRNLFVVGDDAQSIYGFRGSNIRNILDFEKDFPEARIIKLEQNYRSSRNILAAAQKVIEINPEQKLKKLWTENSQGEKIILHRSEDERAEAEFVARKIISLASGLKADELEYLAWESEDSGHYSILDRFIRAKKMHGRAGDGLNPFPTLPQLPKKHDSLKEYAVLYRTHAQSRALEEVFIETGIPYQIVGGLKFYERKEIKDILAYLRLVVNFRDLISLKRVINEPPRGIGEVSYAAIRDFILDAAARDSGIKLPRLRQLLTEIELPAKQFQSAQDFFALLEEFGDFPARHALPELIRLITVKTGYEKFLRDGSEQGEGRWENVLELFTVAGKYKNMNWADGLQSMLEEVALMASIDDKDEKKDTVTLMTLHSAKGLEFDNVFFVGLEEGILPHSRSLLDPSELSEEVRLAYVGLTRARKRLFLVYAASRRIFGQQQFGSPSRVLKVIPHEVLQYSGGAGRFSSADDDEAAELTVEKLDF